MEDGHSSLVGENTQPPLPLIGLGNDMTTAAATEQIEVDGTQTEGRILLAMASIPQILVDCDKNKQLHT